jgi:hypothetical protein
MKWKRSRKAQQESKNKDKDNHEEKREKHSNSSSQNSNFKNGGSEKVITNLAPNNFHFPKNDMNTLVPPHPMHQQRHLMPGPSKEMMPEEGYLNRQHQGTVFTEGDDMIWRVV